MIKLNLCWIIYFPLFINAQSFDTTKVSSELDSLINVSRSLTGQSKFDSALEVILNAEKICLATFGAESAEYGSVCFNHGRVFDFKGNFQDAEKWYLESKAIRERILGKEHPDYATSLNNLAYIYQELGDYSKAIDLNLEAKDIRERTIGKNHQHYASSLNNLAILYLKMGKPADAESYYLEAKDIIQKTHGKEHPEYANYLNNLGDLYSKMGRHEKAEAYFFESLKIKQNLYGKNHPAYAFTLKNLSNLYKQMGDFEKAKLYAIESVEINKEVVGVNHPEYARSVQTLGGIYLLMGKMEEAEIYLQQSLDLHEKLYGSMHAKTAGVLTDLAVCYKDLGNFEKAEAYYLQAITILEKALGKENISYVNTLNNLGVLYWTILNYKKAELLFLEVKAIRKKLLGSEHQDYAGIVNNLGGLYADMGQFDVAEPLLIESMEIKARILGEEHPSYTGSINNLGAFYFMIREVEKAESFAIKAVNMREKLFGKQSPEYLESLNLLAKLYEYQKKYSESSKLLEAYFALKQTSLSQSTSFLSEQELGYYSMIYQEKLDELSAYLYHRWSKMQQTENLSALVYDQMLFHKGFIMTSALRLNTLANHLGKSSQNYQQYKMFRLQLAREYTKPIAERSRINELEEKANTAEKQLAKEIDGYTKMKQAIHWNQIQGILQKNEAAIEFINFPYDDQDTKDHTQYAAILVKPELKTPVFIPLFEEKSLDSILRSKNVRRLEYVNELYSLTQRGVNPIGLKQSSLTELIYKPLESHLENVQKVYYSLSGLLHQINLDAIPISSTESWADRMKLVNLLSTRQLVINDYQDFTTRTATVYGGIYYDSDTTMQAVKEIKGSELKQTLSFHQSDVKSRGLHWNYLPGTEQEINSIQSILSKAGYKMDVYKAHQATEESFKNIGVKEKSPQIIHLATHGYFFEDQKENFSERFSKEDLLRQAKQPMLRSGLILSGGNTGWMGKELPDSKEDGILTAYEISQMNLSNTELVVLSACETGLGNIQGNEGVYGLQRAFKIAGAKYLIMSLWQVPDKQTSMLMITFYKKWLEAESSPTGEKKMSIPDAFHAAQKELRDLGFDPYQWAGFVLIE
ncbi:MAG: tetratricopeptide repeat protein [Saprospiraceae bacterium]|nr:tetratricopeptide repeat protein [Saprospiraceae bacterium]